MLAYGVGPTWRRLALRPLSNRDVDVRFVLLTRYAGYGWIMA